MRRKLFIGSILALAGGFTITKLGQFLDLSYGTVSMALAGLLAVLIVTFGPRGDELSQDREASTRAR
jgi:hypothetical protein